MRLGKMIAELQKAQEHLGADAEVVTLLDNWWDCRSSDREWPAIISVVELPKDTFASFDQVALNSTPEPPYADIITWEKLQQAAVEKYNHLDDTKVS